MVQNRPFNRTQVCRYKSQVSRQLQQQLDDAQRTREDERKQMLTRLEEQRTTLGGEIKELRDRNAAVSRPLLTLLTRIWRPR